MEVSRRHATIGGLSVLAAGTSMNVSAQAERARRPSTNWCHLRTANALGFTIPTSLLATVSRPADVFDGGGCLSYRLDDSLDQQI